jgi:hypothetical protein
MYVCMYVDNPNNSRTGLDIHGLNTRCKNQLSFQLQTSQLFKSNNCGVKYITVCPAMFLNLKNDSKQSKNDIF